MLLFGIALFAAFSPIVFAQTQLNIINTTTVDDLSTVLVNLGFNSLHNVMLGNITASDIVANSTSTDGVSKRNDGHDTCSLAVCDLPSSPMFQVPADDSSVDFYNLHLGVNLVIQGATPTISGSQHIGLISNWRQFLFAESSPAKPSMSPQYF